MSPDCLCQSRMHRRGQLSPSVQRRLIANWPPMGLPHRSQRFAAKSLPPMHQTPTGSPRPVHQAHKLAFEPFAPVAPVRQADQRSRVLENTSLLSKPVPTPPVNKVLCPRVSPCFDSLSRQSGPSMRLSTIAAGSGEPTGSAVRVLSHCHFRIHEPSPLSLKVQCPLIAAPPYCGLA